MSGNGGFLQTQACAKQQPSETPLPSVLFLGRDTCLCWTMEHALSSVFKEEFTS